MTLCTLGHRGTCTRRALYMAHMPDGLQLPVCEPCSVQMHADIHLLELLDIPEPGPDDLGRLAAMDGQPRGSNPFDVERDMWKYAAWNAGWREVGA